MAYYGERAIDETLRWTINTSEFDTGNSSDADSDPTYRVYEENTDTPILTGTMALLDDANTVGYYTASITLSAANGFENGKNYSIRIAATVSSVSSAMSHDFIVKPAPLRPSTAGRDLDVAADGSITAAVASVDAAVVDDIWDEVFESSATCRQALRIIVAAVAGKVTGGGTSTIHFRDIDDAKNRITATVDENDNRTAITLDGS